MSEVINVKAKEFEKLDCIGSKAGEFTFENRGCAAIYIRRKKEIHNLKRGDGKVTIKNLIPVSVFVKSKGSVLIITKE